MILSFFDYKRINSITPKGAYTYTNELFHNNETEKLILREFIILYYVKTTINVQLILFPRANFQDFKDTHYINIIYRTNSTTQPPNNSLYIQSNTTVN